MKKRDYIWITACILALIGLGAFFHFTTRRHVELRVESSSELTSVSLTISPYDEDDERTVACRRIDREGTAYSCEYKTNESALWGWSSYPEGFKVAMSGKDGDFEWPRDRCKLSPYAVSADLNDRTADIVPKADYCCGCTRTFEWGAVYPRQ